MKKLVKAQAGKIVKTAIKVIGKGAKAADKAGDLKKKLETAKKAMNTAKSSSKELSVYQKERAASGKPVWRGSNPKGNMTMKEIQAKKDLQKAVKNRTSPKKLTKEQQYQKDIESSYYKKGGAKK